MRNWIVPVRQSISSKACETRSEAVGQELLLCAWDRHRQDGLYQALFAVARLLGDEGETFDPGAVLPAPETAAEELVGHSCFPRCARRCACSTCSATPTAGVNAEAPGVAYLQKPFAPTLLTRRVRALLDKRT